MGRKTNVKVNGSNYYRVTATVGKREDGSPIRKQFYGVSKQDAEQKRDEFLSGIKQGLSANYDKVLFGVAFINWLDSTHSKNIKASTYNLYSRFYKLYIKDCSLSGMHLVDIKAQNIRDYINELAKITTEGNTQKLTVLLKQFFKFCVKDDMLIKNPADNVKLPEVSNRKNINTALSDDDVAKLVRAAKENLDYLPFVFCAYTGLREGECIALTYKDIDLIKNEVHVNKTVGYFSVDGKCKHVVTSPKTKESNRSIPIHADIKPLLLEYMKNQKVLRIKGDSILFPTSTGEYYTQGDFLRKYKRLCERLGIENGTTIHSLRHTFCTMLCRQGVSLLVASKLMGHTDIKVTAKIYAHVDKTDVQNAVQKLQVRIS